MLRNTVSQQSAFQFFPFSLSSQLFTCQSKPLVMDRFGACRD